MAMDRLRIRLDPADADCRGYCGPCRRVVELDGRVVLWGDGRGSYYWRSGAAGGGDYVYPVSPQEWADMVWSAGPRRPEAAQ